MENLYIKATKNSPEIDFKTDGNLSIKGKSYPENSFEFYKPIIEWLKEYTKNPNKKTILNIELEYFNSSSSKILFDIFDLLDETLGENCEINWIYDIENEIIEEAGEDFKEDIENLKFNLISKS